MGTFLWVPFYTITLTGIQRYFSLLLLLHSQRFLLSRIAWPTVTLLPGEQLRLTVLSVLIIFMHVSCCKVLRAASRSQQSLNSDSSSASECGGFFSSCLISWFQNSWTGQHWRPWPLLLKVKLYTWVDRSAPGKGNRIRSRLTFSSFFFPQSHFSPKQFFYECIYYMPCCIIALYLKDWLLPEPSLELEWSPGSLLACV